MTDRTVLASGPALPWGEYEGGQREAIIGGVLFEGLAPDRAAADALLASGEIVLRGCQELGCVGSVAGVYTASMPVFVVRNETFGDIAFCSLYEGATPRRLNYGCYDAEVRDRLLELNDVMGPLLARVVDAIGEIPLRPIIRRALHMGDELHSRNTAATLLFERQIAPVLLELAETDLPSIKRLLAFSSADDYFFLRLSMAAAMTIAMGADGIAGSSVVTSMAMNCRAFAIRVSGLPGRWFVGSAPDLAEVSFFDSYSYDDVAWLGGESTITETVGLGGFAQAAAFALQRYQGGTADRMVQLNEEMYTITIGEHPEFRIPALGYRGTPTAIDASKVVATGIQPVMDIGIAGRDGGQIGAGVVRAPMDCFEAAEAALAGIK